MTKLTRKEGSDSVAQDGNVTRVPRGQATWSGVGSVPQGLGRRGLCLRCCRIMAAFERWSNTREKRLAGEGSGL